MAIVLPQVVFGTYEAFLLGYVINQDSEGKYKFTLNMATHAHLGSIRSVSTNNDLLASAGADEYVNVFNLSNRKELAVLTPHEGTVTTVVFAPDGSHLISGSQDGDISIFKCTNWKRAKSWKNAHKKPNGVVGMAMHPSGKLLLSIGADHILRVWNMVKGRQAYAVNFGKKITPGNTLNLVMWSKDGAYYAIAIGSTCEVYKTETAAVSYSVTCESRISCFDLSSPDIICIGRDDGNLEIHNYLTKEKVICQELHERRIKCLQLVHSSKNNSFFVTADSQGVVRLWRWKLNRQIQRLIQEAEVNADCRIVCMALYNPTEGKRDGTEESSPESLKIDEASKENGSVGEVTLTDSPMTAKKNKIKSNSQKTSNNSGGLNSGKKRKDSVEGAGSTKRKSFSTSEWTVT